LITINQDRLLKLNLKSAKNLNSEINSFNKLPYESKDEFITLSSENKNEEVKLELNSLLFIRSANNYIEVYQIINNQINKTLLRSTLNKAASELQDWKNIFRAHRTSLVNLNNITEVKGNSQGYKLYFKDVEEGIPVSRSYARDLLKKIKA